MPPVDLIEKNKLTIQKAGLYTKTATMAGYTSFFANTLGAFLNTVVNGGGLLWMWLNIVLTMPGAFVINWLGAALSFREAQLKNWKAHPTARFVIDGISAVAITVATAGLFAATTSVFLFNAIPLIFTSVIGLRAIFHLGETAHYIKKAIDQPEERRKNVIKAIQSAGLVVAHALVATAIVLTFVVSIVAAPEIAFAGIGIVGGLIGLGVGISKLVQAYKNRRSPSSVHLHPPVQEERSHSTNSVLSKTLGVKSPVVEKREEQILVESPKKDEPLSEEKSQPTLSPRP